MAEDEQSRGCERMSTNSSEIEGKGPRLKIFFFLPFEPISPDVVLGREFIKSRMQQISFSQRYNNFYFFFLAYNSFPGHSAFYSV